jgi:hypothetical protein
MGCSNCSSDKNTIIGDYIICLNCGYQEYLYDYRNAFDEGSRIEDNSELDALKEQVNDLQAIVAEPGRIPRQYNEKLQQLQGEVAYLRNKVNESQSKRNQRYDRYD